MTREEVVKWLESLKREIGKAENRTLWHYAESIDIAIKALEDIERWRTWSHTYDDLISRQDALDAVIAEGRSVDSRYLEAERIVHESDAVEALSMLPSADRPTGEWILDPNGMDWNIPAWRCSECGFVANYIGVEANGMGKNPMNWAGSKFCPNCGAKMKGADDED